MNIEDIIRMAREVGIEFDPRWGTCYTGNVQLERFAALVAAAEREKLAAWMIERGYATGHGETVEDLLKELEWQIAEREREACAKAVEAKAHMFATLAAAKSLAAAIRARSEQCG